MRLAADEKGASPLGEQLVALAGVIAAAVVAVTAGAWYARRRWER
jgi:hypothetical protein